jgi:aconitate hydratase
MHLRQNGSWLCNDVIDRESGTIDTAPIILRIDTRAEVDYVRHGGIMPYILAQLTGEIRQ